MICLLKESIDNFVVFSGNFSNTVQFSLNRSGHFQRFHVVAIARCRQFNHPAKRGSPHNVSTGSRRIRVIALPVCPDHTQNKAIVYYKAHCRGPLM